MENQEIIQKPCPDCGQEMDGGNMAAGVKFFYCPACKAIKFFVGDKWVCVAIKKGGLVIPRGR